MKLPKFGFNKLQSYIDFVTNTTRLRFGLHQTNMFAEVDGTRTDILNVSTGVFTPTSITTGAIAGTTFTGNVLNMVTPLVTTPVSTVTILEKGDGRSFTTTLTLTNFIVGHIPAELANLTVGNIVAAFPAGTHIEEAYYQSLSLKLPGAAVVADLGLGSVLGVGVHALLSDADAGAEDRITGQSTSTDVAGGTTVAALIKTSTSGIAVNIPTSVKNVFLNGAGSWAAVNHGDLTASGIIVLKWTLMGIL